MEHSTRGVVEPVARVTWDLELLLSGRPIRTARVRPVGEVPGYARSAEVRGHVVHMTKFYRSDVVVSAVSGMRSVEPSYPADVRAAPAPALACCAAALSPSLLFRSLPAVRSAACRRYADHISACAHGFRRLPSVQTSPLL